MRLSWGYDSVIRETNWFSKAKLSDAFPYCALFFGSLRVVILWAIVLREQRPLWQYKLQSSSYENNQGASSLSVSRVSHVSLAVTLSPNRLGWDHGFDWRPVHWKSFISTRRRTDSMCRAKVYNNTSSIVPSASFLRLVHRVGFVRWSMSTGETNSAHSFQSILKHPRLFSVTNSILVLQSSSSLREM